MVNKQPLKLELLSSQGIIMGMGVGFLFLLVLGISWINNVDARNLLTFDVLAKQVNLKGSRNDSEVSQEHANGEKFCALCEQYTSQAIEYLSDINTQNEIIATLHQACSRTFSLKKECLDLVNQYVPLFFLEVAKVEPGELCSKVYFCDKWALTSEDSCTLCHEAVAEILTKLEDPDKQLEILQMLLKACDKSDQYAKQCKRLVFEYGPLIFANADKFLVKNDVCVAVHACKISSSFKTPLLAES